MSSRTRPWIHPGSVREPTGSLVEHRRGPAYRIDGVEHLAPFLVSVISSSDHWLFASSTGGLTCGRVDASRALFAYETDDRLHTRHGVAGPLTLVRAWTASGAATLWEPLDDRAVSADRHRRLTKGIYGTWLEYEEVDTTLGLVFRMTWSTSDRFGLVRDVELERIAGSRIVAVEVLDGLVDVMPALVPLGVQQTSSTLVDAYKRVELDPALKLGVHALEARLSDRAEPAEALRANIVWSTGAAIRDVLTSCAAPRLFREGRALSSERVLTGQRGAHLVHVPRTDLEAAGPTLRWRTVADLHLSAAGVARVASMIASTTAAELERAIDDDVAAGEAALVRLVASADGLQQTRNAVATAHHFSNVTFNVARGGVFVRGHDVPARDFEAFVGTRNRRVLARHAAWLRGLSDTPWTELSAAVAARGDAHLVRIFLEYLPLTFSRRHGDPSRPWNRFDIHVRNEDGTERLGYQGNWRDIFQNWEALSLSFPEFLPSMVARFVDASTMDGFNPYRVTRDGIDWEIPEPENPWSNLGYWGDHQVAYLVRMLERWDAVAPGELSARLDDRVYAYADVPYRLRPHAELVQDPRAAITFDHAAHARVMARQAETGSDGAYVTGADGEVVLVSLAEKLIVPALAKLSCLVPDGGIWMNTQRPEWNDANNALAGTGVSVVTLAHLARYLHFLGRLLGPVRPDRAHSVSAEVVTWLRELRAVFDAHERILEGSALDDAARREILDGLGEAFTRHRARVYAGGLSAPVEIEQGEVHGFFSTALRWVLASLRANRRDDGLYHAYNLLALDAGSATLSRLPVMLEGQVAVLSSGYFALDAVPGFMRALFASELWREDQQSFVLYPAHARPGFLEKNVVAPERVASSALLGALVEAQERSIVERDARGVVRFAGDLESVRDVARALDHLAKSERWASLVAAGRSDVLDAWEQTFNHHAFTGRSGTMHKYEGLGCIYWHMVAKLLVAVQELVFEASDRGAPRELVDELRSAYFRVRAGLGHEKTPALWGAFPTDPYSHSPLHLGAQQPGMTGVVKEEILTRLGELGVRISRGLLHADGVLLSPAELTIAPARLELPSGKVEVPARAVALTVAEVPIVVETVDGDAKATVVWADGRVVELGGAALDRATTAELLSRRGRIARVCLSLPARALAGSPSPSGARTEAS
ncbi:hypothetical protein L6R52_30320 [Myxococcota bacterium]|nr:hypothetical protein [Myxococcota bacterium]